MGLMAQGWPATFPSGQGSDLAGFVAGLGDGVTGFAVGDEVLGWTDSRASQAEFVVVEAAHLVPKPAGVSWEAAGSLFVAGVTAYAMVRAVSLPGGRPRRSGRRRGRRRLDCRTAGPHRRGHGDRPGQREAPSVAVRSRRDPGELR